MTHTNGMVHECETMFSVPKFHMGHTEDEFCFPDAFWPRRFFLNECFSTNESLKNVFELLIYPGGVAGKFKKYLSVYLRKFNFSDDKVYHVKCTLSIADSDDNLRQFVSFQHVYDNLNNISGVSDFISHDFLKANHSELLPEGELSLYCELVIVTAPTLLVPSVNKYIPKIDQRYPSRSEDVLLIWIPGKEIAESVSRVVSKTLLSRKSHFYDCWFKYETTRFMTQEERIDKIDLFLFYIYTDNIPGDVTTEDVFELYYLADKYDVVELRKICVSFLKSNVDSENALYVLGIADLYCNTELRSYCLSYIRSNYSKVESSNAWSFVEIQRPDLVREILTDLSPKKTKIVSHFPQKLIAGNIIDDFSYFS